MKDRLWLVLLVLVVSGPSLAEMKALGDEAMSDVSGQSGITLDLEAQIEVAEAAYFEDGNGIALQGVRLTGDTVSGDYADMRILLDILADGSLALDVVSHNTARFEIEDIRFVDTPGVTPAANAASLGGFFFDFELDGDFSIRNRGNGPIGPDQIYGGIYDIDFLITGGRLGYRTNGNEFFLDGMVLDVSSPGTVLGATAAGELALDTPDLAFEMSVDAIRFSNNPNNHGVTLDVDSGLALPSYGSLWVKADVDHSWRATAGGRVGVEGLAINSQTTFNSLDLAWGDDTDWAANGYWIGALGITGQFDVTNLTLDVLPDPDEGVNPAEDYGLGLAMAFERVELSLLAQDVVLGETKTNIDSFLGGTGTVDSIGSLGANLTFADGSYDGTAYTNSLYLQAGGNADAGYQGLRLDTQLSIISPNNESNFVYIDDGNAMMWSGFEAYADGDLTLDVTAQGTLGTTEFYDGLRLGFEDFAFGYRVEGLRAAKDTGDINDLKNAELQSAQTITGINEGMNGGLFGLGGRPSLTGTLNGHITLGPGGNIGQEGVRINSDLELSNASSAVYVDSDNLARGIWLSGLNYDVHLRDMMLDVTDDGLRIYESESWSKMDVTDFRIGDQVTGASFGRLVLETYEQGSISTWSAGGAGQVCIGGNGADETSCTTDGGRWEDRGTQGMTISSQRHFKDSIEAEGKRNRFTWEIGRIDEGTPAVQNGTGMQLVFDNFTTRDADGVSDTYGLRTEHSIDVASAYVVKKSDGLDSNGVNGDKGDVKVMNADGTYRYVDPALLTPQDMQNLPIGIATRTRTHFQELDIEQVNLVHPTGGESTLLYGLKLQNFDVTTDITTTALD